MATLTVKGLNEVDMFCLHTVFLPRISNTLDSFVVCWNNHPLSTSHNMTKPAVHTRRNETKHGAHSAYIC